jgi:DNA-binding transcriptional MocR family regulator
MYVFDHGKATVTRDRPTAGWLRHVQRDSGRPIYLALVDALETAVRDGELLPGDQLPPQRAVADQLDIDFTTVTRAYGAARARGLVEGAVGRGTFVRRRAADDEAGLVDLSMNLPPPPRGVSLAALLKETTAAILDRTDVATLMAYHAGPGTPGQRAAGAAWLAPSLGEVELDRIVVCPGAQSALTAVLTTIARPGAAIVVEPLTYPGLIALAQRLGLRLTVCPVDDQGFCPRLWLGCASRSVRRRSTSCPTTRNPVATTMGPERRRELAAIVAAGDAWLIEDDPYSRLFDVPLPALTSLAPERDLPYSHPIQDPVAGPAHRFPGRAVRGDGGRCRRRPTRHRPDGFSSDHGRRRPLDSGRRRRTVLAGVRQEARTRRAIAADLLPMAQGDAEGIHVWLDLPAGWDAGRVRTLALSRGLSLVAADAFAAEPDYPNGLRISLGGPARPRSCARR